VRKNADGLDHLAELDAGVNFGFQRLEVGPGVVLVDVRAIGVVVE
jgi:hypothetical protein